MTVTTAANAQHTSELFGDKVIVFQPTDNMDSIHNTVERINQSLVAQEMSHDRYALLFMPGDYRKAGLLRVPYYVHLAGLGKTPYDVQVSNVHTPPRHPQGHGLVTFWRSMENMSVIGKATYDEEETFKWAVSQAAPLRRVYSERTVRYQWGQKYVSGGFTADCNFMAPAGSDGQQQWYTRNSHLECGRGKFAEGAFNFVFQGVELGKKADKDTYRNNWDEGGNVTFLSTTPVVREKPFIFIGDDGKYKVFRPALRRNSVGVSYTRDNMGEGEVFDVERDFFIVKPSTSALEINMQLASGKHIIFMPGFYEVAEAIHVTRPGTIVMGLGWSTLVPAANNPDTALRIDDVDGVTVCSLLFDAHHSSRTLISVEGGKESHKDNPTLLADLFFRVGGFLSAPVHVDCAIDVKANDVIGDHFWIWRADHGVPNSTGWTVNTCPVGIHVKGDDVTIYGLFNEHFQQYQTLWEGERGRVYFYQCETPYDSMEQYRFMSENGTRDGYAAYKVADNVEQHEAHGLGIYDVFFKTNIRIENSMEVPEKPGILVNHLCNVCLSDDGPRGFGYLINGKHPSTYNTHRANRTYVDRYVGGQE